MDGAVLISSSKSCSTYKCFWSLKKYGHGHPGGGSNLSMGKQGLMGLILCRLFAVEGVLVCSWADLSHLYSMTMAHSCIISTNDRINSFCSSRLFMSVWSPTCARYALTWSTSNECNMRGIQICLQHN